MIMDKIYYGIETQKALLNFPISNYKLHKEFIISFAQVKQACAKTNKDLGYLSETKGDAIINICKKIINGEYIEQFVVDAFQGGAGTSTNMNVNEVIASLSSELINENIDSLNDVNKHQSTNDTYPTALKVTVLRMLQQLEQKVSQLQESFQKKEQEFENIIKTGRTELQDAVPMTLGMTFSTFAEAIARDRWRIFKARERIKVVNLGGTAIGTGLGAPRDYIFKVVENLKNITGLVIARGENLVDATQNLDSLVEVSSMLKTYGANLLKIANDLRFLSCGPECGIKEINIPSLQAGSSIMPGKVNPVILEAVSQVALKVMSDDYLLTLACSMGQLELNHLTPLITHSITEMLEILINITILFKEKCIDGITANKEKCSEYFYNSKSIATILVPVLGYKKVEELVNESTKLNKNLYQYLLESEILPKETLNKLLSPQNLYKLGFTKDDYK